MLFLICALAIFGTKFSIQFSLLEWVVFIVAGFGQLAINSLSYKKNQDILEKLVHILEILKIK